MHPTSRGGRLLLGVSLLFVSHDGTPAPTLTSHPQVELPCPHPLQVTFYMWPPGFLF